MIGIIGAMSNEVLILKKSLENYQQLQYGGCVFYTGIIAGKSVVIANSGIGKVNASLCASIMIREFSVKLIINTGIAGGISNVNHREIILANKLGYHDVDATAFGYEIGQIPGMPRYFMADIKRMVEVKKILQKNGIEYAEGVSLTGDKFVSSLEQLGKNYVGDKYICEMEGAAIAQVCYYFNVPIIAIRYVSDVVGVESQIDDYVKFEKEMSIFSSEVCLNIINSLQN